MPLLDARISFSFAFLRQHAIPSESAIDSGGEERLKLNAVLCRGGVLESVFFFFFFFLCQVFIYLFIFKFIFYCYFPQYTFFFF